MSNGVLGKSMSSAGSNVTVYTAPSGIDFATISITLCNLGGINAAVRLAIGTNVSPSPQDYVEYGAELPANGGILERTCLVVSPNENVIVFADSNDVSIRVFGLEKI